MGRKISGFRAYLLQLVVRRGGRWSGFPKDPFDSVLTFVITWGAFRREHP